MKMESHMRQEEDEFLNGPRPIPGPAIRLDGGSMGKSRTGPRPVPGLL